MGVGEFLSSKAENEWILSEREREAWEMDNYPDGEIREMEDLYIEKGMEREDAEAVVKIMAKYKDFFVDVMMAEELELKVPEDDYLQESFREGLVMFCSFAAFGAFPLLGYVIIPISFPDLHSEVLFTNACVVTGIVLFLMGCVKSKFRWELWYDFRSGKGLKGVIFKWKRDVIFARCTYTSLLTNAIPIFNPIHLFFAILNPALQNGIKVD